MSSLISAQGLVVRIGQRLILNNINLNVEANEILTVIGPNGAGKSTLIKALLGLQPLTSGTIKRSANLHIGYMPQKVQIDASLPLTVNQFLALTDNKTDNIRRCLDLTQVQHLADQPVYGLSGGETQRVLLARAMLKRPNLLVLDEPVQGVDVTGQAQLYQLIADIRTQYQCAVIMVSHDLHLVMAATDNVICLNQHVCCHGHPDTVSTDPAFLELFGQPAASPIAIYTHHHDHTHDPVTGDCQHD